MNFKRQAYLASVAAPVLATFWGGSALAADAGQPAAAAPPTALEEVIVTARKREESLQNVPVSIAAVSGEALRQEKIVNQVDLSMRVPAFKQTTAGVNTYTFIRGVGSGSNPSFEQAVATFVDGVYAGRGQQARFPYFDLERVEVLRGPQVALYGNSAIAGAISVVSRKPGHEFGGEASASYEFNNQETVVQGGVTIPLNDAFRLRLAGYYDNQDKGWLTTYRPTGVSLDPQRRDRGGRVILAYDPGGALDAELKYESYSLLTIGGSNQATSNVTHNGAVTEYNFDLVRYFGNGAPLNGKTHDSARMNNQTVQATVNYKVPLGTLTAVTAYNWYGFSQDTEGDMSPLPIFDYDHHEHYRQFSQELRLTSNTGGRFDYIVGAYYQRDHVLPSALLDVNLAAEPAPFGAPIPPLSAYQYLDQVMKNYAVFFDANYALTPRLKLNVAARYMHVTKDATLYRHATFINTTTPNPAFEAPLGPGRPSLFGLAFGAPHTFTGLSLSETHLMPQVGLQYEFEGGGMAYAKVVKGAKAGGFDWSYAGADPNAAHFLPERATSYEAGYRGEAFDHTLSFGLTLYRTDVKDLQVSVFDGRTSYVVGNAAQQRSQGVEADFTWRPVSSLRIVGSGAYDDAYYVSYANAGCYVEQRLATPAGVTCRQDLSGAQAPLTSRWAYNLGFVHTTNVGQFVLTTQANYSWRSKFNMTLLNDPQQVQKAFGLLDARIALGPPDQRWQFAVFGKNLTDELYSDYATDAPTVTGVRFRDTQRPRQIGVELSTKF